MKKDVYSFSKPEKSVWLMKQYFENPFISFCTFPITETGNKEIFNNIEKINLEVSKKYFDDIEIIATEYHVSSYSVFLACLYILLYKYTFNPDVTVCTIFPENTFKEIKNTSDTYNNMILSKNVNNDLHFIDLVKSIHENTECFICGSTNSYEDISKYPLCLEVDVSMNCFNLQFNKDSFDPILAKTILAHYLFILKQVLQNPNCKISDFGMITPEETRLLEKFNQKNDNPSGQDMFYIFDSDQRKLKAHALDKRVKSTKTSNVTYETKEISIESYDYTKINDILSRNSAQNLKTISKINPRKYSSNWRDWLYRSSYCLRIFKTKYRRPLFLS